MNQMKNDMQHVSKSKVINDNLIRSEEIKNKLLKLNVNKEKALLANDLL